MLKTFDRLGEVDDVQQSGATSFTVWFVASGKRDAVAATTSNASLERSAKRIKTDSYGASSDPPNQRVPPNIADVLNDDCLMEIFQRLHMRDLYTIAWTCKRLRALAVRVFQGRYRQRRFGSSDLKRDGISRPRTWLSQYVHCVRIFRPTSVGLCYQYDKNIMLRALAEYCPDLEEIDIGEADIEPPTMAALRPVLPRLRQLVIGATDAYDNCGDVDWRLEKLNIEIHDNLALPSIKTPRLTELRLTNYGNSLQRNKTMLFEYKKHEIYEPQIFSLLAKNAQLKTLQLHNITLSWDGWCSLADRVPNIDRLVICNGKMEHASDRVPGIFNSLAACELEDYYNDSETFLQLLEGAPLEELKFSGYMDDIDDEDERYDVPIDRICRLTTITRLTLEMMLFDGHERPVPVSDDGLMQLTRSLPGLQELYVRKGRHTLGCISRILGEPNAITKLGITMCGDKKVRLEPAVLDDISAKVAARPELDVHIEVRRKCLRVSEKFSPRTWRTIIGFLLNK